MMTRTAVLVLLNLSLVLSADSKAAAMTVPPDFRPDPPSVQRYGPAYRYPQAGWVVLHIEGEPYQRGYQHGRLMAPEIAAALRCFAALHSPKAPDEGWKNTRSLANALFMRRYTKEYLEEMKGIAAGATAAGARFGDRPIDLVDIVGLNAWPEIDTLDSALEATPTGLEGTAFPNPQPRAKPKPKPMHCSAFAATGPATADGKIIFGHITMFALYPSLFYNVWLDVKPARGHRVLMQSFPGGIQSGLDYYLNDAGLLVCETTLTQTRFNIKGMAEASRIRQALQYADTIDQVVEVLKKANNGLYTNEWLLADIKTNEIAMFELGTAKTRLYRSSKHEWFGGTEGFYWGCNNTKDMQVRLETVAGVVGRPGNMVWHASERDRTWVRLYHKYKGKMDADFGRIAFTTPPIAAYPSLDAKFTTTDLARDLKTWALFGPPLGRTWQPTDTERQLYPEIRPMVSNPWTVLHAQAPVPTEAKGPPVVDLPDPAGNKLETKVKKKEDKPWPTVAAWHGTVLPKTDADVWLAAAFADYERIVAREKAYRDQAADGRLTATKRQRLGVMLSNYRSVYLASARAGGDTPLKRTHADIAQDHWYRVALGKGVLVLHELRQLLGDAVFKKVMDTFGRQHAGQEVTSEEFQAWAEKISGKQLGDFFKVWLEQPGLPLLRLSRVKSVPRGKGYQVVGEIERQGLPAPITVEVYVETANGQYRKTVPIHAAHTPFTLDTQEVPDRLIVDKYGWSARANGEPFSVLSFYAELDQSLIVRGTADEVPSNREAARALQQAIRARWMNVTVPIKSDQEVTEEDLKTHHLLLIGRPQTNRISARCRAALPVVFGAGSFVVRHETYAHAGSAVVAAGANPLNRRYSVVVLAGLSAEATLRAPSQLLRRETNPSDVLVLAHGAVPRALVVPAAELVHEFTLDKSQQASKPRAAR